MPKLSSLASTLTVDSSSVEMSAPGAALPALSAGVDAAKPALAELVTEAGTFLIQERRARPRPPEAGRPRAGTSNQILSSQMIALGGLIIIGVLVGSYTTKYDLAIGHRDGALAVPQVGFLALQLFLARAALRSYEEVAGFAAPLEYIVNRALRYLPAAIPGVLLGFSILTGVGVQSMRASLADLPANLTLVTDMVGGHDIDAAHWRLKIEIVQALFVGLAWFTGLRRHIAILLTAALLICALTVAGEPGRQNVLTLKGVVTGDGYLPLFAFGVALQHLVHDRSSLVWRGMAGASLVMVVFSNSMAHGLVVAGSLLVLVIVAMGGLAVLGRIRVLVRLGELAFPIYVVHFVMGFAIIQRLEAAGAPALVAILAASVAAIVLGSLLNTYVERPIQKNGAAISAFLRRVMRGYEGRRSLAAQAVRA